MNKSDLKLDWASHKAALYACKHWHYSKRIPVNKLLKIGVWENNIFIGVIIFGVGASATLHKQFGLRREEVCELVRVALNVHKTPVSRMMSISLKFLKNNAPNLKIVVSFADPSQGHYGGIYQANNWVYTGMSQKTNEYFYNGSWRHATDVYKRLTPKTIKTLKKRKKAGKHRYIMPLTKEMREKILPMAKPYPKACKVGDDPDQGNSGGATPTCTLHKYLL